MSEKERDLEIMTAHRKLAAMGIKTFRQLNCLLAICFQPNIRTGELGEVLGINRSSTQALTVQLEGKGLITVTKGDDGDNGRRFLHLTNAGQKAIEEGRRA